MDAITPLLGNSNLPDVAPIQRVPRNCKWKRRFVVLASFLINFVCDGIGYGFGVLIPALQSDLLETELNITTVGAVNVGMMYFTGILASALIARDKMETRIVCGLGALISSLAIFLSSFCSLTPYPFPCFFISFGVIGGFGQGLMYYCASLLVGFWYKDNIALVTGFVQSGSGVGAIVLPFLIQNVSTTYGWSFVPRLLAGLCFICIPLSFFMRKPTEETVEKQNSREQSSNLKHTSFILFLIANLPAIMAQYIIFAFLPKLSAGKTESPQLINSMLGAGNSFPRIILGATSDSPRISALALSGVSTTLNGLFSILFLFSTTTTTSCALAFFWGATQSTIWCLATRIISDMLGLQSLAGALGILTAVRGVACSIGPPAGAWLDYRTGSIRNVFWLSGLLAVLGSIFILISWTFKKYQDKRTEKQDNQRSNYGSIN